MEDVYNDYLQPKNDVVVDELLLHSPLKSPNTSKTCLASKPKPYFTICSQKVDKSIDGLAPLFSNFEITLNRSFEITKSLEDLKMKFYATL
jgi:hypothetical protein